MTAELHKILCVDDEPRVLEALNRHLREHFQVLTADSGAAAIDLIKANKDLAIVLSDMRMPEMDGATLLRHSRALQPTAVRVLLTGQADIAAAIKAINEGQIFRFLTKPCPPEQLLSVLEEAVRQYELVVAERILLQRTVVGSIRALTDIMLLISPVVMGRALRLRRRVATLASRLDIQDRWQIEAAALLSHLGHVSLPDSLNFKVSRGRELSSQESERLSEAVRAANRLIAHVPRLEPVSALLTAAMGIETEGVALPTPDTLHVDVLRLAIDADSLEAQGLPPQAVLDTLQSLGGYAPALLDALRESAMEATDAMHRMQVSTGDLEIGMVLDEDLVTTREVVIAPRGCEVTSSLLEHVRHFAGQMARSTVAVLQPGGGAMRVQQVRAG